MTPDRIIDELARLNNELLNRDALIEVLTDEIRALKAQQVAA